MKTIFLFILSGALAGLAQTNPAAPAAFRPQTSEFRPTITTNYVQAHPYFRRVNGQLYNIQSCARGRHRRENPACKNLREAISAPKLSQNRKARTCQTQA